MNGAVRLLALAALGILVLASAIAATGLPAGLRGMLAGASAEMNAASESNLVYVLSQFCFNGQSNVVLSLPADASFSLIPSAASNSADNVNNEACLELGVVDFRKLVLCKGKGPAPLTVGVNASRTSEHVIISLDACGEVQPAGNSPTFDAAAQNPRPSRFQ